MYAGVGMLSVGMLGVGMLGVGMLGVGMLIVMVMSVIAQCALIMAPKRSQHIGQCYKLFQPTHSKRVCMQMLR
jgi:hypothetical protein